MSVLDRLGHLILWLDQGFNILVGSGYCDEMYSSFAHRKGGKIRRIVNTIFFWQADHCQEAFITELQRRHLPPEYRK